jgi:phosphoribosylamine--glycine ligase
MGAYAPAPIVTREMMDEIRTRILEPCITGIAAEGRVYRGVLYAGLMITAQGPRVIEFNCRFGDPETQVVLPLLESDLVPLLLACCDGTLNRMGIGWKSGSCVSVVMASGGYPGPFTKGFPIHGIEEAEQEPGVTVFHAGTAHRGEQVVTNGGRVLNVTATAPNIAAAIEKAYAAVGKIHFDNAHYRTDIGQKAIRRLGVTL